MFGQQEGPQFPAEFRAFHREGLVRALGLHLEGLDPAQHLAQVLLGHLADGIKVLFADGGTAEPGNAEHLGHPAEGLVHVDVLVLGLDVQGALGHAEFELAQVLQAVADLLDQLGLKGAAVQALEGHFALEGHDDFSHVFQPFLCSFCAGPETGRKV